MKCLLLVFLLLPEMVSAHPGWGIVLDRQGNVFYTDLENVWRIDASGRKTIAVPRADFKFVYRPILTFRQ